MNNIPEGYCQCGCGQETNVVPASYRGHSAGRRNRFVKGHHARLQGRGPAWIRVDRGYRSECWIWQRVKTRNGYGRTRRTGDRKILMAHRVVWEVEYGPIPRGYVLHHECQQPDCVNLAHLKLVTHAENIRKGRLTKLTIEKAREMRAVAARYSSGRKPKRMLAQQYGVSVATVESVLKGWSWKETE